MLTLVASYVQGIETLGEDNLNGNISIAETEAEIRKNQKLNSNALIQSMLFMPHT